MAYADEKQNLITKLNEYNTSEEVERKLWIMIRDLFLENGIGSGTSKTIIYKKIFNEENLGEIDINGVVNYKKKYVNLYWDSVPEATHYIIYKSINDFKPIHLSDYEKINDIVGVQYNDFGLKADKRYWYRVFAVKRSYSEVERSVEEIKVSIPRDAYSF